VARASERRTYFFLQQLLRLDMVLLELVVEVLESFEIFNGDPILFQFLGKRNGRGRKQDRSVRPVKTL
jgi:hypothetical protein